jgi:hypothetical protein
VNVRTISDEEPWPEVVAAFDRLWRAETFEGNTHLADYGVRDVVDEFFPATDGWTIAAAEPGYFAVLYVLRHREHGVGVMTLGTVEPGGGLGTEEAWDALSVKMRSRNTVFAYVAQGPTALAILTHFKHFHAENGGGRMRSSVENFVYRILGSPEFMDAEAATMVHLGAFDDLVESVSKTAQATKRASVEKQIAARREAATQMACTVA